MKTVVYVMAPDRHPLMPCSGAVARLLLTTGKAKVVHRIPFTIKLLAEPETTYTHLLTLGIDMGSTVIGSAVSDEQGRILYLSETTLRNDIADTMQARAQRGSLSKMCYDQRSISFRLGNNGGGSRPYPPNSER